MKRSSTKRTNVIMVKSLMCHDAASVCLTMCIKNKLFMVAAFCSMHPLEQKLCKKKQRLSELLFLHVLAQCSHVARHLHFQTWLILLDGKGSFPPCKVFFWDSRLSEVLFPSQALPKKMSNEERRTLEEDDDGAKSVAATKRADEVCVEAFTDLPSNLCALRKTDK